MITTALWGWRERKKEQETDNLRLAFSAKPSERVSETLEKCQLVGHCPFFTIYGWYCCGLSAYTDHLSAYTAHLSNEKV